MVRCICYRPESKVIEEIVKDVREKLEHLNQQMTAAAAASMGPLLLQAPLQVQAHVKVVLVVAVEMTNSFRIVFNHCVYKNAFL